MIREPSVDWHRAIKPTQIGGFLLNCKKMRRKFSALAA
jgi:hypothetical protein